MLVVGLVAIDVLSPAKVAPPLPTPDIFTALFKMGSKISGRLFIKSRSIEGFAYTLMAKASHQMPWISFNNPCPACEHSHTLGLARDDAPSINEHFQFLCPEKGYEVQLNMLEWSRRDQSPADSIEARPASWGGSPGRSADVGGGQTNFRETP